MYLVFLRRSPSTGPSGRFLEKGVRRGRAADWCATSLSKAEQVIITEARHLGHQLDSGIEHSLHSAFDVDALQTWEGSQEIIVITCCSCLLLYNAI